MANPLFVLPDPTLALIQYLRARSEVTALVPSARIISQINPAPVYPLVVVTSAGSGSEGIWPAVDDAALQVDAYGTDQANSFLIARTIRAAVWAINNDIVAAGVLTSGDDEIAPQWLPDQVTKPAAPLPRVTARYRIILHP